MTLEKLVGQRLVFGIPGTTATPEIIQHLKETNAGGLMLYRINFASPDGLRKLISDLEQALGRRLLICTDHEGGRVIMFGQGITVFPSSQAIGRTGNPAFAHDQGEQEARELRRLGVDVNFAPVLDVLTEEWSPNIGIRAYGSDVETVAKMGAARLSAMQVEGVSAVAKHFPGLGPATLDPHLALPVIQTTWEEMEKTHLVPFHRAMRTAVHGIMTSHPLYPQLDPTPATPATFSRKIVRDYLRGKVGYKGVIFSDDLEMGALKNICPIGEAAVRAAEAGHDMLLVCHDLKAQRDSYEALLAAARSGRIPANEFEESGKRIQSLMNRRTERFSPLPATPARAARENELAEDLVKTIRSQSVTVLQPGPGLISEATITVIFPRLASAKDTIFVEEALHDEAAFWKDRLPSLGRSAELALVGLEPPADEIQTAVSAAKRADQCVLFLYDAHMHPTNRALLEAVQAAANKLIVVLMRDVYDAAFVKPGILCLTNYGYRIGDIDAVLAKLAVSSGVPTA